MKYKVGDEVKLIDFDIPCYIGKSVKIVGIALSCTKYDYIVDLRQYGVKEEWIELANTSKIIKVI